VPPLVDMISLIFLGLSILALPSALAATYDVSVGAGGLLRFNPENVTAAAGDVITFTL
jgi:plastocyanin